MEKNPYAPPRECETPDDTTQSAARIRRNHLVTEAGIKVMAICYLILAPIVIVAPHFLLRRLSLWQMSAFFLIAVVQSVAGVGLWHIKPWSRPLAALVSVLGLLAFPIGTPVNIHFLRLLFGKKGRMIFSHRYREIVKNSPNLAGGFSRSFEAVSIVLGLLFAGFLLGTALAH